jgi:transketolase
MRTAFINTLCELAEHDDRIWLLCGDLGYSVLEGFASRFPERYVNVGIAEQNMAGMAAGLAMSGKNVFVYSIANFPTMRCLEQIRNDICYHNANVKIVSVGGGYTYGSQGYTHHGVEDIAVMRVLPNMTVVAPGDPIESRLATKAIAAHSSPCYFRLGKAGEPIVHQIEPEFQLGKAITVREGKDLTLISTGGMLELSVQVADKMALEGCFVQVISMPTVSPCDQDAIIQASRTTGKIITIEEHGIGGLGTIVAEILAEIDEPVKFIPLRLPSAPVKTAGSQNYWREKNQLSVDSLKQLLVNY